MQPSAQFPIFLGTRDNGRSTRNCVNVKVASAEDLKKQLEDEKQKRVEAEEDAKKPEKQLVEAKEEAQQRVDKLEKQLVEAKEEAQQRVEKLEKQLVEAKEEAETERQTRQGLEAALAEVTQREAAEGEAAMAANVDLILNAADMREATQADREADREAALAMAALVQEARALDENKENIHP